MAASNGAKPANKGKNLSNYLWGKTGESCLVVLLFILTSPRRLTI